MGPSKWLSLPTVVAAATVVATLHHPAAAHTANERNIYHGLTGSIDAAYELLERVIPTSSSHFVLSLVDTCDGTTSGQPCFTISDSTPADGTGTPLVNITGTSVSEITAAIGVYLREVCNMTIGWPRGGGSNIFTPSTWPMIGEGNVIARSRAVPWSYIENVCTHSYSLVWYNWTQWSNYIDWMALSGINMHLAVTGQEEVAYAVFSSFGLDDLTIRSWFNGPAFLTWSRGQNTAGNNIGGPLPRSFMQDQWNLQKQILQQTRSLGIVGQLPGFQGNVPWALAAAQNDTNMTQQGATGWMWSTDPLFAKVADAWMQRLCADFNCTDRFFQLDGYFDGGTAPWLTQGVGDVGSPGAIFAAKQQQGRSKNHNRAWPHGRRRAPAEADTAASSTTNVVDTLHLPACTWSTLQPDTYLAGCDTSHCVSYPTLAEAQAQCLADVNCGGITSEVGSQGPWEIRAGNIPITSPFAEVSYYITNYAMCRPPYPPVTPDETWKERGAAAFAGLQRTVPDAIWSFQGWAIIYWSTPEQASSLLGFVEAVPRNQFVVIDMDVNGNGEWKKWNYSSFFGAPFIWTTLHNFGGSNGIRGDLSTINRIPSTGMLPFANSSILGTGVTPEGIDTDTAYYEFMAGTNWRADPVSNITESLITRAHRRYGLTTQYSPFVANAWAFLANSSYSTDLSPHDPSGIIHLPGTVSQFEIDRRTPSPLLCFTFRAWGALLNAPADIVNVYTMETYRYDLVNVGREVLAQLSTPISMNFSDAIYSSTSLNASLINTTGNLYLDLLADLDTLVATDPAFLLGPWLQDARNLGAGHNDCNDTLLGDFVDCSDFMEWNARCQITTWFPTPANVTALANGPDDYAGKQWSGLVNDYYRVRVEGFQHQALVDAAAGRVLNTTATNQFEADLAYSFQTAFPSQYPTSPVGDFIEITRSMLLKWGSYYSAC